MPESRKTIRTRYLDVHLAEDEQDFFPSLLQAWENTVRTKPTDKNAVAGREAFRLSPRMPQIFSLRINLPSLALLLLLGMFLPACQTKPENPADWDVPLTLKTFSPTYSGYVQEITDTNNDGSITLVEWVNAGGDQRSFLLADTNKDGVVTRTELVRLSSDAKFFDFVRRYGDFNKDGQLTPREFRSAGGVRVLRFTF